MELVVNAVIGMLVLIYDVVRGLLEWGDKALLVGAAAAVGSYLGVRAAVSREGPKVGTGLRI